MLYIVFALVIILGDQLLKWHIMNTLALGETAPLIPGVIQLTYFQNTGVAFGFLRDHQWIPTVLNPIIILGLILLLVRGVITAKVQRWAMTAVIAGALGNVIDRFIHGFVVDMFDFLFVRFAIFNIADIFITLGGATFIIAYLTDEIQAARAKKAEAAGEDSP